MAKQQIQLSTTQAPVTVQQNTAALNANFTELYAALMTLIGFPTDYFIVAEDGSKTVNPNYLLLSL